MSEVSPRIVSPSLQMLVSQPEAPRHVTFAEIEVTNKTDEVAQPRFFRALKGAEKEFFHINSKSGQLEKRVFTIAVLPEEMQQEIKTRKQDLIKIADEKDGYVKIQRWMTAGAIVAGLATTILFLTGLWFIAIPCAVACVATWLVRTYFASKEKSVLTTGQEKYTEYEQYLEQSEKQWVAQQNIIGAALIKEATFNDSGMPKMDLAVTENASSLDLALTGHTAAKLMAEGGFHFRTTFASFKKLQEDRKALAADLEDSEATVLVDTEVNDDAIQSDAAFKKMLAGFKALDVARKAKAALLIALPKCESSGAIDLIDVSDVDSDRS